MISDEMIKLVEGSSAIRAMFEEGKKLASIYGAENVYDYSLGNPSVEPPKEVKEAIIKILNTEEPNFIHGYTNNSGFEDVRQQVAEYTNRKFGTSFSYENVVMTNGAAAALNIIFRCILKSSHLHHSLQNTETMLQATDVILLLYRQTQKLLKLTSMNLKNS